MSEVNPGQITCDVFRDLTFLNCTNGTKSSKVSHMHRITTGVNANKTHTTSKTHVHYYTFFFISNEVAKGLTLKAD